MHPLVQNSKMKSECLNLVFTHIDTHYLHCNTNLKMGVYSSVLFDMLNIDK